MPKRNLLGLVCAGPVSQSSFANDPRILDRLGPVKAASLRVASRAANSIRAGHPVASFEELETSHIILFCVPDSELIEHVDRFSRAKLRWPGRVILLCDSEYGSCAFERVRELGAAVASYNPIEQLGRTKFIVEGDVKAVTAAKRLFESREVRAIPIPPERKSDVIGTIRILELLTTSIAVTATETIKSAHVSSTDAQAIVERTVFEALRSFLKAGRNSVSNVDIDLVPYHLAHLCTSVPDAADYYRVMLNAARRHRPDLTVTV